MGQANGRNQWKSHKILNFDNMINNENPSVCCFKIEEN